MIWHNHRENSKTIKMLHTSDMEGNNFKMSDVIKADFADIIRIRTPFEKGVGVVRHIYIGKGGLKGQHPHSYLTDDPTEARVDTAVSTYILI